jgi:hypothetical protein
VKTAQSTRDQVEAACTLDPPGEPIRIIHRRVDCWARETIWQALRDLKKQGRVAAAGDGILRRYWRVSP